MLHIEIDMKEKNPPITKYDRYTLLFGAFSLLLNWGTIGFSMALIFSQLWIVITGFYIGAIISPLLALISIWYNTKSINVTNKILALFFCIVSFIITAIFWYLHFQGNIGGY